MVTVVIAGAATPQRAELGRIIAALDGLHLTAAVDGVQTLPPLLRAEHLDVLLLDLSDGDRPALEMNAFFQQFPALRPRYVISYSGNTGAHVLPGIDAALEILLPMQHAISAEVQSPDLHLERRTADLLFELGFPARSKGYRYLIYALELVEQNPEELTMLTKSLYVQVARQFNAKPKSVEKTMRDAVQKAYFRGDRACWQSLFYGCLGDRGPVLGEFLAVVHQWLARQQMDCEQ